jgi:hypothetical protein
MDLICFIEIVRSSELVVVNSASDWNLNTFNSLNLSQTMMFEQDSGDFGSSNFGNKFLQVIMQVQSPIQIISNSLAFKQLLLNPHIWLRAAPEVQTCIMKHLTFLCSSGPRCRDLGNISLLSLLVAAAPAPKMPPTITKPPSQIMSAPSSESPYTQDEFWNMQRLRQMKVWPKFMQLLSSPATQRVLEDQPVLQSCRQFIKDLIDQGVHPTDLRRIFSFISTGLLESNVLESMPSKVHMHVSTGFLRVATLHQPMLLVCQDFLLCISRSLNKSGPSSQLSRSLEEVIPSKCVMFNTHKSFFTNIIKPY